MIKRNKSSMSDRSSFKFKCFDLELKQHQQYGVLQPLSPEKPEKFSIIQKKIANKTKKEMYKFKQINCEFQTNDRLRQKKKKLQDKSLKNKRSNSIKNESIINNVPYINSTFNYNTTDNQQEDGLRHKKSDHPIRNAQIYRTLQKYNRRQNLSARMTPKITNIKYDFVQPQKQQIIANVAFVPLESTIKKETKDESVQKDQIFSLKQDNPQQILPKKTRTSFLKSKLQLQLNLNKRNLSQFKDTAQQTLGTFHKQQLKSIQFNSEKLKVEISYRTSLIHLKQILLHYDLSIYEIVMKIPEIFIYKLFTGNQSQQECINQARFIFNSLQIKINTSKLIIKKYKNCTLVINGNIAFLWYYDNKIYLGGWNHGLLGEGSKEGLGIEWCNNKYVYYGQFKDNMKHGIGILKLSKSQIFGGEWVNNKFFGSIFQKDS